jgi:glycosyltransferase involved in cell wall biosynthesis
MLNSEPLGPALVCQGKLEEVSYRHISGWVLDRSQLGEPTFVELFQDNVSVGVVPAISGAHGAPPAAADERHCGFRFNTPASVRDGRPHTIDVRVVGSAVRLASSPREVNFTWFGPDISPRSPETEFLHRRANAMGEGRDLSEIKQYAYQGLCDVVGKPGAPVVILGDANHIGPRFLARYWADRGVPVVLISRDKAPELGKGVTVLHAADYEPSLHKGWRPRVGRWMLKLERAAQRYSRWRGNNDSNPYAWLPFVTDSVVSAIPLIRAVRATNPLFVFGHEVSAYGLATVLCRGCPRFVFPWGADIFSYPEASPLLGYMTTAILRSADLVVPSSETANFHLSERFGVSKSKAAGISWGIDRRTFRKASPEEKAGICARWRIDPQRLILLNSRRFRDAWGSRIALEAFIRLAQEDEALHCILLGGDDTEADINAAWKNIVELGLDDRFTLIAGPAPIETCTEFMSVADVFTSLLGLGDMRSWSVLQGTACGGVPVVADIPEHRIMEARGFRAVFVPPGEREAAYQALVHCVRDADLRREIARANDLYMAHHEDEETQMEAFWSILAAACLHRAKR